MNYYRNDTENNFHTEAEKRGYIVNKSSPFQDMYDHIDFYIFTRHQAFFFGYIREALYIINKPHKHIYAKSFH